MKPLHWIWCQLVGHKDHTSGDFIMCWRCNSLKHVKPATGTAGRSIGEPASLIDVGSFKEMVTVASERAAADGSMVVVHKHGCDGDNNCLCQPRVIHPYEPIDEPNPQ
jgi:hypothetical protein